MYLYDSVARACNLFVRAQQDCGASRQKRADQNQLNQIDKHRTRTNELKNNHDRAMI